MEQNGRLYVVLTKDQLVKLNVNAPPDTTEIKLYIFYLVLCFADRLKSVIVHIAVIYQGTCVYQDIIL